MTENDDPLARFALFVAFNGMGLLDLTGPLTVFWSASRFMEQQGRHGYARHTVSLDGGPVLTAEGVTIDTAPMSQFDAAQIDTIVIPGALDMAPTLADRRLVDWLAANAARARRTASLCAGTFLLAEAGLLDGRRAVTHWASCELLDQHYPALTVEPDAIFVQDGPIWTSAGVSAGIDLSLALIQEDCGREIAMQVARELVIYMKRPGGQSQFSELLQSQTLTSTAFENLHLWISNNLSDERLNVDLLAERVGMSPRNFARSYKAKTGRTPAKAVEVFRLEAARRLLEDTEQGVERIARSCGFGDEERMRTTFQRHLAISPRDYRLRVSKGPPLPRDACAAQRSAGASESHAEGQRILAPGSRSSIHCNEVFELASKAPLAPQIQGLPGPGRKCHALECVDRVPVVADSPQGQVFLRMTRGRRKDDPAYAGAGG
jgi:transcriptional regulator GlxA family with amidase domain